MRHFCFFTFSYFGGKGDLRLFPKLSIRKMNNSDLFEVLKHYFGKWQSIP